MIKGAMVSFEPHGEFAQSPHWLLETLRYALVKEDNLGWNVFAHKYHMY